MKIQMAWSLTAVSAEHFGAWLMNSRTKKKNGLERPIILFRVISQISIYYLERGLLIIRDFQLLLNSYVINLAKKQLYYTCYKKHDIIQFTLQAMAAYVYLCWSP